MDGNISNDVNSSDVSHSSEYDTDDEVGSEPSPANLAPVIGQNVAPGHPLAFDVDPFHDVQSSLLPLCLTINCRSAGNKSDNLRELLYRIGPSITILSETWERKTLRLDDILRSRHFKTVSYYRKNRAPGGGAAIVYNDKIFRIIDQDISVPQDI